MTKSKRDKWTPVQLIEAMKRKDWVAAPAAGVYMFKSHTVNLNEMMSDKRYYWEQWAEIHATPPTKPPSMDLPY